MGRKVAVTSIRVGMLGLGLSLSLSLSLATGRLAAQESEPTVAQQPLKQEALTVVQQGGTRNAFTVELAQTPRQQQVGLMFRTIILPASGMLFVWPQPQQSDMWMKNCPVPEDMVFIGLDNRIIHIAEQTVPYSLANVDSQGVAKATLELAGGATARLGIRVGDLVQNRSLGSAARP